MTADGNEMQHDPEPVVIGGVGGSGTRVVAHFAREFGFYIGDDLSVALDNLWFALLFGFERIDWYRSKPAQAPIALRLFGKAMCGNPSFEPAELAILREAIREWRSHRPGEASGKPSWRQGELAFKLARSMRDSRGMPADARGWGWKDPNTHIFVEQLAGVFPQMKYIHVIRNGLQMANKRKLARQVRNWSPLLGLEPAPGTESGSAAQAALRYWILANRRALELGPVLFGDRFLLVRHESVCEDPRSATIAIGEFLGVDPAPSLVERLSAFVSPPASELDRSQITDQFDAGELGEVEALGFAV